MDFISLQISFLILYFAFLSNNQCSSYEYLCPDHFFFQNVETECTTILGSSFENDIHYISIKSPNMVDYKLVLEPSFSDQLIVKIAPYPPSTPQYITEQSLGLVDYDYSDKLMGIALDGIPIYNAVILEDGNDIFHDNIFDSDSKYRLDLCGGTFGMTPNGYRYHYRVMPTCILNNDNAQWKRSVYISSVFELLEAFESIHYPALLGYSLNGYPIFSPYNNRGLLQTNLDNCNGKFSNGTYYAYYATPHFPYLIGCDGPGVYSNKEHEHSLDNEAMASTIVGISYTSCPGGYYPSTATDYESNGCIPCPAGKYSSGAYFVPNRLPCVTYAPLGYYTTAGSTKPIKCPGGRYGSSIGLGTFECSGPCRDGYFCPSGSTQSDMYPCGGATYYCPLGNAMRFSINTGFYSGPEGTNERYRYEQHPCGFGTYCIDGRRYPCPAGRYGNVTHMSNAECSGLCPLGQYCLLGSVLPIDCPAGRYGKDVGLVDSNCSGACQPGYWCPVRSTSSMQRICAAGRYGAEWGLTTDACNSLCEESAVTGLYGGGNEYCVVRKCAAGYVCPAGSTSEREVACGSSNVYCPAGSVIPTPVDLGYYSTGALSVAMDMQDLNDAKVRYSQMPCEPGYYCAYGIKYMCSRGRYGSSYALYNETCSGYCTEGYRCNEASSSPTQFPCGTDSSVYCPTGSHQAMTVPDGYYSIGESETSKSSILHCPIGMYCTAGIKRDCPAGRYASVTGSITSDCEGLCNAGFYCPPRSTSAKQISCPAGRFGIRGMTSHNCAGSCLKGYYCPLNSTTSFEVECGGEYVYCPHGSPVPLSVSIGYYSTGGNSTTRYAQEKCVYSDTEGTPPAGDHRIKICPSTTVM